MALNESQIGLVGFNPPSWLRGTHLQSTLGSTAVRRLFLSGRTGLLMEQSEDMILDCGDGVRLLAHHAAPQEGKQIGTVVLIHGWEGSAQSSYVLSAASRLWQRGWRVIRLNLRDHGESHHLNEDLFHSCRLDEAIGAVRAVQRQFSEERLCLAGFSLGGNFALRIAARAPQSGIDLDRVVAVCPVLDPEDTLQALESGWAVYRQYFMLKWRRSLERKRKVFPHRYNFGDLSRLGNLTRMTEYFVLEYTEFDDLRTYLKGYALTGERLSELTVPSRMLLAEDDPVIPVSALKRVASPERLTVDLSRFGGHCGFLTGANLDSWLDDYIEAMLEN